MVFEFTGVLINHQLPLNHQCKKCHNISNHCKRDFISDFSNDLCFYNVRIFFSKKRYVCLSSPLIIELSLATHPFPERLFNNQ